MHMYGIVLLVIVLLDAHDEDEAAIGGWQKGLHLSQNKGRIDQG